MQGKPKLALYGNNSHQIGAGHIMRLFALAQAARYQFQITFIYKTCSDALIQKLHNAGFSTQKLTGEISSEDLELQEFTAFILDDYHISKTEWLELVKLNSYLVYLDDAVDKNNVVADMLVNPAPNFTSIDYQTRAPKTKLCLGPKYTYLRQEFSQAEIPPIDKRTNVLITLGGTDTKSLALPLSKALLSALPYTNIQLLLGTTHQDQNEINQLEQVHCNFEVVANPISVAQVMAQAGLAISAAGGTLGELASLGVPTLALVMVDNQLPALTSPLNNTWYQALDLRKYNANEQNRYGSRDLLTQITSKATALWHDTCIRQQMSDKARQLVDTHGCDRVIKQIIIGIQQK